MVTPPQMLLLPPPMMIMIVGMPRNRWWLSAPGNEWRAP